jgi:hypothetical protein
VKSQHRRMMTAAVLGLSMLAAACGSSKGGSASGGGATSSAAAGGNTKDTVDAGVQAGIKDALGGGSTTVAGAGTTVAAATTTVPAGPPQSMDEWNALWTSQRAAIVKRITDNKWGLSADGKTVTGPEGFSAPPAGTTWRASPTPS